MKKAKWLYLVMGFIAGVSYLVACGGATNGIADPESEPTGTPSLSTSSIVGTWSGKYYDNDGNKESVVSFTFNEDGSYFCEVDSSATIFATPCIDPNTLNDTGGATTFEVIGNTLKLNYETTSYSDSGSGSGPTPPSSDPDDSGDGSVLPKDTNGGTTQSHWMLFPINYFKNDSLHFLANGSAYYGVDMVMLAKD